MISMVSSKNKGKQAKRKYSVKKKASPGVEPGTSAPARNFLTTTPP